MGALCGRHLSINTLDTYKSVWNVHVNPRLGHLELRQITPLTLERFVAELADDGVGAATIRKAMSMLQGMLGRAVAWDRLRANPAPAAKSPLRRDSARFSRSRRVRSRRCAASC